MNSCQAFPELDKKFTEITVITNLLKSVDYILHTLWLLCCPCMVNDSSSYNMLNRIPETTINIALSGFIITPLKRHHSTKNLFHKLILCEIKIRSVINM